MQTNNKDSKVSYTKGEWSFKTPKAINDEGELKHLISIYASDGTHICDKKIISKCLPQAEANAKLMSAAPDLLDAVNKWMEYFNSFSENKNGKIVVDIHKMNEAVLKSRAAIKKATEQ